jgi:hypothetical protein
LAEEGELQLEIIVQTSNGPQKQKIGSAVASISEFKCDIEKWITVKKSKYSEEDLVNINDYLT